MSKFSQVAFLWRSVFALLARAAPLLSVVVIFITIVDALAAILVLYTLKELVDVISVQMTDGTAQDFSRVLFALSITGAAILFSVLLQGISKVFRMRQGLLVSDHVEREIHDRAIAVDMRYYESPAYYDSLERARHGGSNRPAQIIGNTLNTFRAAFMLTAIFILLASIEWVILPLLVVPVALALFIRLHFTRKLFDWRMSRAQTERRAAYLDWLLTNEQHAKDLRINRIGGFFRDQFRDIRRDLRNSEIRIEQSRLTIEFAVSVIGAGVFIGASAYLLSQSLGGERLIGDVVLFVLLLRRAEGSGSEFVGNVSRIVDDHLYLKRLFDFLAVVPSISSPPSPRTIPPEIHKGIALSNVSFRYDGAHQDALSRVSLELPPGKVVALVGENGSGKTSLIKVLTRLYDPTAGLVTLDGTDIREFDPEQYRRLISATFQDFMHYAATVEENVRFGDVSLPDSSNRLSLSAKQAGAIKFIENLPNTFSTKLTKIFDGGHDLSIGQWQRLALARSFYPKSKFVVLDEPTSAMDPKAEYELFENFKSRLDGRGALVISHRLSTIRQADYTYVLERGAIVEHGTHEDLVEKRGTYAELFEKQARNYQY